MKKGIVLSVLAVLFPIMAFAYTNPGSPSGFVNDYAGMLSPQEKQQLEQKISDFEKNTSNEISVVTVNDLGGDTIENFAVKLFEDWKIGKKGKDNGVLLLIAKSEQQMRIEVGYGLEGALTDLQSNWIIQNELKPNFQAGQFGAGISAGVDKIMSATRGEYVPSEGDSRSGSSQSNFSWFDYWYFIPVAFTLLASILGRSRSWWAGGVLGGICGTVIGFIYGFLYIGLIAIGVLGIVGLIFDYFVSRSYEKYKTLGVFPWWLGGGGGGFGGGSGGGFGGFGGGRSGGGGSSGSW